jgi:large subunit ribosomal protein L21
VKDGRDCSFDFARRALYRERRSRAAFGRAFAFSPHAARRGENQQGVTAKKPVARILRRAGLNTEKTMFAVIKTGGKQYKVAAADTITVMALEGDAGAAVTFAEVLALFDGATSQIGAPHVAGASVVGEIVEQTRGPKVIAFKKRRRKNSRRKRGHKQDLTIVKITQILTGAA